MSNRQTALWCATFLVALITLCVLASDPWITNPHDRSGWNTISPIALGVWAGMVWRTWKDS